MKKILLGCTAMVVLFAACKTQDKKSMITGKWQAISLDNPELAKLMDEQRHFLDTFGRNNTPEQNVEVYGFSNIDSAREANKMELEAYITAQETAVKNTWFDFRKDGIVVMNFNGEADSTKWHIDEQGMLTLDETSKGSTSGEIKMDIISLSDTMLKLQLNEEGMSSTVIFRPSDK
ncbi:MAG: hypothetical protein KDC07_01880 [Chitinophagaceae bacterium]|nr:hypothetical protein [Chitinophagaceae bacterium]MCB9045834.1 hypothetical protein [Chitinophagales bacterium]